VLSHPTFNLSTLGANFTEYAIKGEMQYAFSLNFSAAILIKQCINTLPPSAGVRKQKKIF